MKPGAVRAIVWGGTALALAGWACESARNPGGFQRDLVPPQIVLTATQDTQPISSGLSFTASATDNLALNDIRLIYAGGLIDTTDTIFFNQTLQKVTLPVHLTFPPTSGAGGFITIIGRATDGAGNFGEDTLVIFLSNVQALTVQLLSPATGAVASTGRSLLVDVVAKQLSGIRKVGFTVAPPAAVTNPTVPPNDSIVFTVPFVDSVEYVDTLTVVQATGTFTITGFAEDSAGRRATTNVVTVNVLSAANDNTPPQVSESLAARIEVNDTVVVHATDPSGISWIGFRVRLAADTTIQLRFDSVAVGGAFTDVVRRFSLQLSAAVANFPTSIVVDGYACDQAAARNCAFSNQNNFVVPPPKSDSAQVVAGVTIGFPQPGTHIADAIFNANGGGGTGELYLTNNPLSRVEVFQVANTAFVASGILTAGPQPWGVALWPHDTLGNYGDSIVVADAGGTEFSIIDVAARRLRWRQDLPNYQIQLYKVIQIAAGVYTARITIHDLSDRPQFVATVCRGNCNQTDSVFALYSTTPTLSSSSPFDGKGTLRMEKLINTANPAQLFGHFFWEIGGQGASDFTDTLRVVMRRGLPYNDTKVILPACAGVTINFSTFGLGDTTYARNSGNFTHSFFGEGGNAASTFRRVMSYTSKGTLVHPSTSGSTVFCRTSPDTLTGPTDQGSIDVDLGMSPAVDVSDFISNTGVKISSIATNFNGGTNLVRADSIYYLDEGLRLKGLSFAPIGAYGMDMNYFHDFAAGQGGTTAFGGTRDSTNRVVFAADPSGQILVFDTFFYGLITAIPVRDPIVGPLRVAKDAGGNQLLFGVTSRGLVMVRLPPIPNPNPAPPRAQRVRRP
ncbi:MAG TPA: hypothetical protein VLV16_07910 [Gemmatimonadales bacterium]|nr:hypothetical protein [Gemmatimonadales bacterium]